MEPCGYQGSHNSPDVMGSYLNFSSGVTKNCFNIQWSNFTNYFNFTNNISSISRNNNNTAVRQMGEESIQNPPYGSPGFPAGLWTQFCYSSQKPPYGEYITTLEQACLNLEPHNAEELRAEIRRALIHAHNPRRKITKEEAQVLAELRKDHSRVILIKE